jgi:hypothetical protein
MIIPKHSTKYLKSYSIYMYSLIIPPCASPDFQTGINISDFVGNHLPIMFTALIAHLLISGDFAKFRKMTISFGTLVCPSVWNNSAPIGRIFTKFWRLPTFRNSVQKIQVSLQSYINNSYFTLLIISPTVLLKMRNVSDKSCMDNRNKQFMFNNFFLKLCWLWKSGGKILYSQTGHR